LLLKAASWSLSHNAIDIRFWEGMTTRPGVSGPGDKQCSRRHPEDNNHLGSRRPRGASFDPASRFRGTAGKQRQSEHSFDIVETILNDPEIWITVSFREFLGARWAKYAGALDGFGSPEIVPQCLNRYPDRFLYGTDNRRAGKFPNSTTPMF
jgi:hypothetical protein